MGNSFMAGGYIIRISPMLLENSDGKNNKAGIFRLEL